MLDFPLAFRHFLFPVEIVRSTGTVTLNASIQPRVPNPPPGEGGTTSFELASHTGYFPPDAPMEVFDFAIRWNGKLFAPVADPRLWEFGMTPEYYAVQLLGPDPYRDIIQVPIPGTLQTDPDTGNIEPSVGSIQAARVRLLDPYPIQPTEHLGVDRFSHRVQILWDPTNSVSLSSIAWGSQIPYSIAGMPGTLSIEQPRIFGQLDGYRAFGLRLEGLWTRNG